MKNRGLAFLLLGTLVLPLSGQAKDLPWLSSALRDFNDSSAPLVAGWSKKGAAVVLAPVDGGGRGGPATRLLLIDTVEDKILAEAELWPDEFEEARDDSTTLAKAMAASADVREFLDSCIDAGIVPLTAALTVKAFPLSYQGASISATAAAASQSAKDLYGSRAVNYRIVVSQAKGNKTVATGQLAHAFDVEVDGYFLSPWEPRMLVVSWYSEPGFEGEQPKTYFFSGAHLTVGYKK